LIVRSRPRVSGFTSGKAEARPAGPGFVRLEPGLKTEAVVPNCHCMTAGGTVPALNQRTSAGPLSGESGSAGACVVFERQSVGSSPAARSARSSTLTAGMPPARSGKARRPSPKRRHVPEVTRPTFLPQVMVSKAVFRPPIQARTCSLPPQAPARHPYSAPCSHPAPVSSTRFAL
jgi:hypothetical protein